MTKKEWKRAMCCGLGRCVQELEAAGNIEKYREIVLWGCTHELAYDAQCEGTRGWYLYRLARCFPDADIFVERTIACFFKSSDRAGWAFDQFCDFLAAFAGEGHAAARDALRENYRRMYERLLSRRRWPTDGRFPLYDNFEKLCIALAGTEATLEGAEELYFQIVRDVGNLMLENPLFDTWRFDWFQTCQENESGKARLLGKLKERAKNSPEIAAYTAAMLRGLSEREMRSSRKRETRANLTAEEICELLRDGEQTDRLFFVMQARLMRQRGKEEELRDLAGRYQRERDPLLRARLLGLFSNRDCAALLDEETVLSDAESEDCALRESAFRALTYMRGDGVRMLALRLWQKKERVEDVIDMLANNYRPEDHDRLVVLVKALPVTYEETEVSWHGAFQSVLDLLETRGLKRPPKELLPYMYEHTLCSCCRESVLREMGRRRMLTEELLRECRYDCNEAVREYAFEKCTDVC